jgi:hypothetical protein
MPEFDPGPTGAFATHWDNRPSYASVKARFRMNWGPIYYRGRNPRAVSDPRLVAQELFQQEEA